MNPWEPELAIAKRAAGKQPERECDQEYLQGTLPEDDGGPHQDRPHPKFLGLKGRLLPLNAGVCHEPGARSGIVGQDFVASITVVPDA